MTDLVTHLPDGHRGAFVIARDGKQLATMTYTVADNVGIIIDHTEVDPVLRGTGAGGKLLDALVEWVRSTGQKVVPVCPFAKAQFDKRPEIQDVLKQRS